MKRSLLALGAALSVCFAASAQQPPVPGWQQGRPESQAASPLAPNAPRLTVTPLAQVPVGRLTLPAGFKAEVYAHGMPGARMMAVGANGTLFIGTRTIGRVYAVSMENGQQKVRTIASGLNQPNGIAFRDGALYVVAINKVLRFDGIEGKLDAPGTPVDLTAAFALPTEEHHGWKFMTFGPDGKLYMQVGAPCNICSVDENRHAVLVRYNPDGTGPGSGGARGAEQRRHGASPGDGPALVQQQRPRLGRRGRAGGYARRGAEGRASISASPTATWARCRTRR